MTDDDRMEGKALSEVLYERQGPIAIITLNRPEKLNAFNAQLLINFTKALDLAERDETARVVIVKGAGRAFSVGYDVSPGEYSPHHVNIAEDREWLHGAIEKWLRVWEFPKPVIAQVHGYCIAGATMLALCCDITIVSNECKIRWPSLPLGGGLISTMWTWLSGPKKAKEMSFIAGSEMTGAEAHFWGFANRAVPETDLEAVTLRMARQIARTPPDLLRLKKLAINRIMDIQGFRTAAMFGAEWDSIAHFSTGAMNVAEKIQELGLKGAIKWLEAQDE
jgi:enoyl-CoA hydratase/carnithine racemase